MFWTINVLFESIFVTDGLFIHLYIEILKLVYTLISTVRGHGNI